MKNFYRNKLFEVVALSLFFVSAQTVCLANEVQQEGESSSGGSWYSDFWSKAIGLKSSSNNREEGDSDRDAVFMSLSEYKRPSERVIDALSGGDYLGRNSVTDEPCLISDDEDALAVFSNLSPCLMNDLYSESFDDEIATHFNGEVSKAYGGKPPQAFSLKLEAEGINEFCQCTMVKKNMMNLRPTVVGPDGEKVGRRREILNNLARDGMKRIYEKLLKIQKPVAYAMSSREMSGFTGKASSDEKENGKIEASTSLALCMPSEMLKTLKEDSESSQRLCGETGVRRLASGMKKGKTFECVGPEVGPSLPHCYSDPMNSIELQDNGDVLAEMTRGMQMQTGGSADMGGLQKVLERHHKMANTPYSAKEFVNTRRGRRARVQDNFGDFDFSEFESSQHNLEGLKSGEYSEELMEMINTSLQAELSEQGNKLWQRNVKPFQDAFDSAVSNSGKVSETALAGIDTNYLREYLTVNPYLEKRLASNSGFTAEELQSIDEEDLKRAIQTYVEEDMYRVYLALQAPDDYELANIMSFTYGPDYYDTLNKCEEIQKTMISLCRALDQDEGGEESLAPVFTDSRLMALYAEDLEKIYKGEAELGHYSEFEAASYLFCEETQNQEDSVDQMNQTQTKLERELATHEIFLQMENEKKTLHQLAENDQMIAQSVAEKVQETQRIISANPKRYEVINAQRVVERASEESQNVRSKPSQRVNDRVVSDSLGGSQPQTKQAAIVQPSDKEKTSRVTEGASPQRSTNPSPKKFNRFQESFKYDFDSSVGMDEEADDEANSLPIDKQKSDGRVEQDASPRDSSASSIEKELMRELEEMRARESELTAKLDELSEKLEEDKKQEELKEKNKEVDELKEQMRELKEELAIVRAQKDQKNEGRSPAIVRPSENKGLFGPSSSPRSTARTNQEIRRQKAQDTATNSGVAKRTTRSAPDGQESTRREVDSVNSSQVQSSAMLTGTTSRPATKIRVPQNIKIAPPDMSLTSLALNAQGNIALRETNSPGVLERVIFKTQNGEIVYENGYPVIDKRETVSVDEEQEIAESIPEPEETAGREPASIEEELLEIERELRPRASHQELIETLQQNTGN